MNSNTKSSVWLYITFIPSIFALLGATLTTVSLTQQWGGDTKAAYVFALFFAEISLVISTAGLLAYYLKISKKTTLANVVSKTNWAILFSAIAIGLYLFLG